MNHPYRKPQDPPAPPRDVMLPVLWAGGALAAVLAIVAIAVGVLDARHPQPAPVATDPPRAAAAPIPTPLPAPDDPPPPTREAPIVDAPPTPIPKKQKTAEPIMTDVPIPVAPNCPPGTNLKMGMMHQWICCPEHVICD